MVTDIIISLGVALVLTVIFLAVTAIGLNYMPSKGSEFKSVATAAQIVTPFILLLTVVILYRQLEHIQEQNSHTQVQNDLQRAVASKSAIQELNKVILDKQQKEFLRFVFFPKRTDASNDESDLTPGENLTPEEKHAREAMMAFSLMNSLEMLYLTRDRNVDDKAFKSLLCGFIQNVRGHWKEPFPTVYHPDFQKIVRETFKESREDCKEK